MPDHPVAPPCFHVRAAVLFSVLLLFLVPARAAPLPEAMEPLSYRTRIDLDAGIATFAIHFDRAPDFTNVGDPARLADNFQFWTDTVATDPAASTRAGIRGAGPLGTQMMVTTSYLAQTNLLSLVWPQFDYPGPRYPGGWGSVEGATPYTLTANNTLSFDVPLTLLRAPDGHFNYVLQTYRTGAWNGINYFGVSGVNYVPCVPEPAHAGMLGAGMLLLAAAGRRGRKQRQRLHGVFVKPDATRRDCRAGGRA